MHGGENHCAPGSRKSWQKRQHITGEGKKLGGKWGQHGERTPGAQSWEQRSSGGHWLGEGGIGGPECLKSSTNSWKEQEEMRARQAGLGCSDSHSSENTEMLHIPAFQPNTAHATCDTSNFAIAIFTESLKEQTRSLQWILFNMISKVLPSPTVLDLKC